MRPMVSALTIGVDLGLDLPGAADLREYVFPDRFARHNLGVARLRARNHDSNYYEQHNDGSQSEPKEAFSFHLVTQSSFSGQILPKKQIELRFVQANCSLRQEARRKRNLPASLISVKKCAPMIPIPGCREPGKRRKE